MAAFEAPVKRTGGGYTLPPRLHIWHSPDLDAWQPFTAAEQEKAIESMKSRLTKPEEELMRAAIQGDETAVKLALRNGARVNAADETGQTALIKAARHNNVGVVIGLMNNGADVNKGDAQGWTPLFWASRMGSVACVKELMNPTNNDIRGCDYGARSKTDSRVKDIADSKVLRTLDEEKKARGSGEVSAVEILEDEFGEKKALGAGGAKKQAASSRQAKNSVRKARKVLMNAWGEHSLSPKKATIRPRTAPAAPTKTTTGGRRTSIYSSELDPRTLSKEQKERRVKRLMTAASTSIQGYMNTKEQHTISGSTRLDYKKKDLVLREGLVKDMIRNSPDPTVYSLIWKYETHSARGFNDRVLFRNWAEM